tara:strand:+ start:671 stop:793 length:123 start_codon:yes stop_codon:yes gene_type:complete
MHNLEDKSVMENGVEKTISADPMNSRNSDLVIALSGVEGF